MNWLFFECITNLRETFKRSNWFWTKKYAEACFIDFFFDLIDFVFDPIDFVFDPIDFVFDPIDFVFDPIDFVFDLIDFMKQEISL